MAEATVNVADEFETIKQLNKFLLHQAFDEGLLEEEESFLLLHTEENNNPPNFP